MDDLRDRMEFAADAVWQAGKLTLRHFQTDLSVELKEDHSPVTVADRETEVFLVDLLRRRFPADAVLGEERGAVSGSSGYRWVIDPIDGTKSFVRGVPLYGVMLGLLDSQGESVVGAIGFPALGDLVVAARGEGCFWNGRRARVSTVSSLRDACVLTTGHECFEETGTLDVELRLRARAGVVRGWGDCYGHVLVATGRAEAMLDPVLNPWDLAPLPTIVEEAGGVFTDWGGRRTSRSKSGISTNAAIADEVRVVVRGHER